MTKTVRVFGSSGVIGADAVCVLFANHEGSGLISGIFEVVEMGMCVSDNPDGTHTVFPYCYVNNEEANDISFALTVPKHGLIRLPNYTGYVITTIHVA